MPFSDADIARLTTRVEEDGAVLRFGAEAQLEGLPAHWIEVLASDSVPRALLESVWSPWSRILPRTLRELKRALEDVAILETNEAPPSLVYLFRAKNTAYAFRGFVPLAPSTGFPFGLPAAFTNFYREVHDGWLDLLSLSNGPAPSRSWFLLSSLLDKATAKATRKTFDPARFLVVYHNGGGSYLGFDLDQEPALCFLWSNDEPPEIVPDVWEELDALIAADLKFFDSQYMQ